RLPRFAPQGLASRARKHRNEIPPAPWPQSMLDASSKPRDRLNEMQHRDDKLERKAAGSPIALRREGRRRRGANRLHDGDEQSGSERHERPAQRRPENTESGKHSEREQDEAPFRHQRQRREAAGIRLV